MPDWLLPYAFVLPTIKAVGLLAVGAAGTLLINWLGDRRTAKQAAAKTQHDDQVAAKAAWAIHGEIVLSAVAKLRDAFTAGTTTAGDNGYKFSRLDLQALRNSAIRLADHRTRSALKDGADALNNVGLLVNEGVLDESPRREQWKILTSLEEVAGSLIRGEDLPAEERSHLAGLGDAIAASFAEHDARVKEGPPAQR